jgi:tetratricopeptide (TPR) repeat protein
MAPGCSPASRFERNRPREVLVEVLPRGAEVWVDGRPAARGSATIPAPPEDRELTVAVRAAGYEAEELTLAPGDAAGARVGAALRPEGFPGPTPELEDATLLAAAADYLLERRAAADARDYAARAAMVEPRLAIAHRVLGDARAALGDLAGAAASWTEYLRLSPYAEDAAVVEARIEEALGGRGPAGR